jgi:hypothetical protein
MHCARLAPAAFLLFSFLTPCIPCIGYWKRGAPHFTTFFGFACMHSAFAGSPIACIFSSDILLLGMFWTSFLGGEDSNH